ncbi:MAG: hypothetical protein HYU25_06625 [Candidatus Rokubacteria bacterium]|nr:hypothetical protein [Candidatus Rokubacteria bacterium]
MRAEYAGRLLECPVCRRRLRAGGVPGAPRLPAVGVDPAFDRDVFLLRERVLTIRSKYEVWAEDGTPILYVERPTYPVRTLLAYVLGIVVGLVAFGWLGRAAEATGPFAGPLMVVLAVPLAFFAFVVVSMSLRPLRHVTVYRDESRTEPLLRVLQDQRVAFLTRTYTVLAKTGEPIARLRKTYLDNIVRKRWYVEAPDGQRLGMALEDSIVLSLLRRILGTFFGVLRTNFILLRPTDEVFGEFNRKFTLLDRYVLDLSLDPHRTVDRRITLALGVMLDTGERR